MTTTAVRDYVDYEELTDEIRDHFGRPLSMPAPVDVTISAASRISREWGEFGYSIRCVGGVGDGYGFVGRARDGGEFFILLDHYCNYLPIPEQWLR